MPPIQEKNDISKAMEKKRRSIELFQHSKEESMTHLAISRDSTLIALEKMKYKEMSDEEIKEEIKKWYRWLRDAIYKAPFV